MRKYKSKYKDDSKTYGGFIDYVRVLSTYAFYIQEYFVGYRYLAVVCRYGRLHTFKEVSVKHGNHVGVMGTYDLRHSSQGHGHRWLRYKEVRYVKKRSCLTGFQVVKHDGTVSPDRPVV